MAETKDPPPRKLSRAARRAQLIQATIAALAARGYARITMTDIANQAGLSHGLVNFHFKSKELLLTETLHFLAEEYRANWAEALAKAPANPAQRLDAMLRSDFNPEICTPAKLAAWCAFWGEAQSRPLYQEQCGSNDADYLRMLEDLCAELRDAGSYSYNPTHVARVLRVTLDGVWLDMMTMSAPYSREEALATVHAAAAAFFPKHFNAGGLIDCD
ncbi:MAG: TetR family transcriptional regulator C-terminal domain-containing protein [Paracoccaceae bacterium]